MTVSMCKFRWIVRMVTCERYHPRENTNIDEPARHLSLRSCKMFSGCIRCRYANKHRDASSKKRGWCRWVGWESRRLLSNVERKSVKERDEHFTARGQCARYTVADCAPIAECGSRPAFVDPRGTLRGARAAAVLSRPTRRVGAAALSWKAEEI